ncbi:MAG: peptide-binding protein [Pirellulales bacterium]|nr:peptide-binding protein [Pirellulales bacterium]
MRCFSALVLPIWILPGLIVLNLAMSAPGVVAAEGAEPFRLGNMSPPFTPPSSEELEKTAEWEDLPVIDPMVELRKLMASQPPLATVEEALGLQNDSPEANRKILSALSVLAPVDGRGVDFEATINRGLQLDLSTTNPILYSSIAESQFLNLTSFGLFSFDWEMRPFASSDSVVSWQTSKDRMVDKVVMRKDLVWSDGKPITAHDVEFSYRAIMTSQVPVPAVRAGTDELKCVKAYDDYTVMYFHKAPGATNVWNVNYPILPKHVYEKSIAEDSTLTTSAYHANLERHPIAGGPYELAEWTRGSEILLRRRENYYMHNGKQVRDKPYFKQIRFRVIEDGNTRLLALKSGRIDEGELDAEQWETQTSDNDFYAQNTKVYEDEWTFFYIGWNLTTPFFQDVRVRRAMAHAMNYDEMIDDLCFGLHPRCYGIFHPDSWMYPKNPPKLIEHDLDKAEELLDDAGWVDSDGDGIRDKEINGQLVPFEFSLMVSQKPDRINICNLFRENLEGIGVVCHIVPMEAAVFQERVQKKRFEAELSGWSTGTDPYTNENIFGTGQDRNYGSYSNPKVDALFKQGMKEFDREKRAAIYGEISNLIYEDQPYLFLYTRSSFYGFNKKLRGYRFSPRGPFSYGPGFGAIWTP